MYNLLEYSKKYRKTTGSLWNYYRDEPNNLPINDDDLLTVNYNADPIISPKSFKYKSSITGKKSNTNQENSTNQIKKIQIKETPSKEIQRLKKILKLLFH